MEVASTEPEPQRKRRLSRKEQKARKKQRQKEERHQDRHHGSFSTSPASSVDTDSITTKKLDDATNYLATYVPIKIPNLMYDPTSGPSSLGKWFPKAKVIKSKVSYSNDSARNSVSAARASLLLFYQYASPPWPESKVSQLLVYLSKVAERRVLGGRIRVAPEGVNATVSSVDASDATASISNDARETLRHFCEDLRRFDPAVFRDTDFKFIDDVRADRHFKDLKLLPVKELVFYGISDQEAPLDKGGVHLDARDFHAKLQESTAEDTVVIDVRNHYEAAIGRFDGQQQQQKQQQSSSSNGGAEYIDPRMRKSTDFPQWLAKPETQEKLKHKTVMLYCTGGVRCERASAYLKQHMGDQVNGVYQLKGGIERYLQTFPDGGCWRGKNFVFDKREAVGVDNREGDGGVLRKQNPQSVEVQTHCCICHAPWDRYVGKKKCHTCGVPVLICDACLTKKKDAATLVRCPLCVEEGITVAAANVEYTDNGRRACSELSETGSRPLVVVGKVDEKKAKAAPSVLKWGGGHASEKKKRRRLKRKQCKFGADCKRADCLFAHPQTSEGGMAG